MFTKEELHKKMNPQMDEIISTWNNEGIILETQFSFVTKLILRKSLENIYQIILENGGKEIKNEDVCKPIPNSIEIKDSGWFVYFFNPDVFDLESSTEYAENFYLI